MNKWKGKSKGTVLGYRIFVWCIRNIGIRSSYGVLYFVAAYYSLFQKKSNQYIRYYFQKRLNYGYWKSKASIFKSYFTFGKVLIDKTAISAGLREKYTYEFDGIENLRDLLAAKKGGVLISAHIGNFEIAEHFFADIDFECQINLVTTDQEVTVIKEYLESVAVKKSNIKFIYVKEDMSHIFEINQALSNNELICFTGDRYFEGSKYLEAKLLGKSAKFPAGPFLIASRLGVPVVYVYVMKENNLHYHLYARVAQNIKNRDSQGLLQSYVDNLETMVKKYPLQWFNYFDFWDDVD
ncbi:putative LPLAT superfamily acyltransferase [Chryseobacterium bernardetii]|jgi:predicted LPLAT superfamily acyltransferase|uniref:LPLAT superfamily acyltransferase n=3 Tax=Chryseobacterium TaxID=59732 RepID=A0ACC6IZ86_9FLAO|nr:MULTISPECIES: lipid A biosynthesis acyltransferase [Chryseobacterium]MDR6372740.1 putative LPLAT superfamily acyltransferase [Chryseobacterium vietnamense]MDR6442958.1 putative LPLAT superfamily acyltransferase [Chryseobacterium bernardetii]MDR6460921.1 putative LPLAT superfamily acyltransferase [Chryseobacterium vietnamense]MDR6489705.1 putative LPLAT superfamily acyltransferase [Chryseobacterium vietnamense]TQM16450.1 putative LPLAT superfamily acyltransferase [Chryseobacterium aquifrigid